MMIYLWHLRGLELFLECLSVRTGSLDDRCWGLVPKCYELRTRQHRKCQALKSFVLRSIISLER
jgi:hypothetical protein